MHWPKRLKELRKNTSGCMQFEVLLTIRSHFEKEILIQKEIDKL